MSNHSNSQQPGQNKPWWKADREASLSRRVAEINRINDPGTNADEVLRAANWIIFALLCYSGLLGGLSYLKNFEAFLPFPIALFLALALTLAIEFGKNSATKWVIRAPFFQGFRHIFGRPENTLMWLGLIALSAGTFTMSVINSTAGGEQLARMLTTERDTSGGFRADTRDIDAQIAAGTKNIEEARKTQWRGTTTTTSQKTILETQKSLTSLSAQREKAIATQRADWEAGQAKKANNDNYTASLVLASGGWVELLVAILILIAVSCEKILDSRQAGAASPTPDTSGGIGFRRAAPVATFEAPAPPPPLAPEPRRPIGFLRDREVEKPESRAVLSTEQTTVPPTVPFEIAVEQRSTAIGYSEQPGLNNSIVSMMADIKEWQKRAQQTHKREIESQGQKARQDNRDRCTCYVNMLRAVGFIISVSDQKLNFIEPEQYNIDEKAIRIIEAQKVKLKIIAERRNLA